MLGSRKKRIIQKAIKYFFQVFLKNFLNRMTRRRFLVRFMVKRWFFRNILRRLISEVSSITHSPKEILNIFSYFGCICRLLNRCKFQHFFKNLNLKLWRHFLAKIKNNFRIKRALETPFISDNCLNKTNL